MLDAAFKSRYVVNPGEMKQQASHGRRTQVARLFNLKRQAWVHELICPRESWRGSGYVEGPVVLCKTAAPRRILCSSYYLPANKSESSSVTGSKSENAAV